MARAMRYSTASLLLAAVLAVSLAGKLAAGRPLPTPDDRRALARAAQIATSAGYRARLIRRERAPALAVVAERGDCHMLIGHYPPFGGLANAYRTLARPPRDRIHFIYRDTVFASAPKLIPLAEHYATRELRRIGLDVTRSPMLAVVASPACEVEQLPWNDLRPG